MAREAYKKLGYDWESYEAALKRLKERLEEINYNPYTIFENKPLYEWKKQTSFDTELFLLPCEFNLISLDTLLVPIDIPELPHLPDQPPIALDKLEYPDWYLMPQSASFYHGQSFYESDISKRKRIIDKAKEIQKSIDATWGRFKQVQDAAKRELDEIEQGLKNGNIKALEKIIIISHQRHPLPLALRKEYKVAIDQESQIVLIEFKFPDYSCRDGFIVSYTGKGRIKKPKLSSQAQTKKYIKQCLYSLIIRSAYLTANLCIQNRFKSVVVNVEQDWHDPATGTPRNGLIASLQANVDYLCSLDLSKLDPETCFKHLKGINTPSLQNISPIRPIFVLNKEDSRFVNIKGVDGQFELETNLAAIPWEDFEHLVAQLFEWEFKNKGIEVKVTRATRDRGVDAILFDPDPLRGGKYVLQAKRYTNTVDVSAVRDLYGTLMNEGANRGILITTSSYGPDAYEFAKDKPISLVDGPNLILMLQKHGKKYRIDLEEARRLNNE